MVKIPQAGDIRVGYVPPIAEHALTFDAPDMTVARAIYHAISAIDTLEATHDPTRSPVGFFVQRFENGAWEDVDPDARDSFERDDVWIDPTA